MTKTKEEKLKQQREHKKWLRDTNPEYRKREIERAKIWASKNKSRLQSYYKDYRENETKKYKKLVYDLLGRKCVSCGYSSDLRALQIDHIKGGGREHHKKHSNYTFYKDVLKLKGKGFQVLCANCNVIKKFENKEFSRFHSESKYKEIK